VEEPKAGFVVKVAGAAVPTFVANGDTLTASEDGVGEGEGAREDSAISSAFEARDAKEVLGVALLPNALKEKAGGFAGMFEAALVGEEEVDAAGDMVPTLFAGVMKPEAGLLEANPAKPPVLADKEPPAGAAGAPKAGLPKAGCPKAAAGGAEEVAEPKVDCPKAGAKDGVRPKAGAPNVGGEEKEPPPKAGAPKEGLAKGVLKGEAEAGVTLLVGVCMPDMVGAGAGADVPAAPASSFVTTSCEGAIPVYTPPSLLTTLHADSDPSVA
jgi:hypothetical protein